MLRVTLIWGAEDSDKHNGKEKQQPEFSSGPLRTAKFVADYCITRDSMLELTLQKRLDSGG